MIKISNTQKWREINKEYYNEYMKNYMFNYRKKDKNEDFTTKERLIGVFIVFFLSILYLQLVG